MEVEIFFLLANFKNHPLSCQSHDPKFFEINGTEINFFHIFHVYTSTHICTYTLSSANDSLILIIVKIHNVIFMLLI